MRSARPSARIAIAASAGPLPPPAAAAASATAAAAAEAAATAAPRNPSAVHALTLAARPAARERAACTIRRRRPRGTSKRPPSWAPKVWGPNDPRATVPPRRRNSEFQNFRISEFQNPFMVNSTRLRRQLSSKGVPQAQQLWAPVANAKARQCTPRAYAHATREHKLIRSGSSLGHR